MPWSGWQAKAPAAPDHPGIVGHPHPSYRRHCPILAVLRPMPRFAGILAKAKKRAEAFGQSADAIASRAS